MCHPPTCVYRVYIAACCVICLIGAVAVIAIGMALGYRMGEDSVYNFKENRPNGVAVSAQNREQMLGVQSHFKHITTSLTGSGIVSGTISMIGGYGACCNLALALYLFMVGVAMLVVAEVATGAIVYYKQTLILETLTEFRQNGICGTICFLDDLVSRQLMSAVIIVIGMTVLQVGQIVCAYCIVRRLSTPKPVRNIQHAVRRMTAHLFNIHSTAVAVTGSPTSQHNAAAVPASEGSPASGVSSNPAASLPPIGLPSLTKQNQLTTQPDLTPPSVRKATFVSEGAQTDDLEELTRPLLSSRRTEEPSSVSLRRCGSSNNPMAEVVEVVEETVGPQKSCLRYSVSSRPGSVSSAKDIVAAAKEALQKTRTHQNSNHIGKPTSDMQSCVVSVNVRESPIIDTTTSAQGYHSTTSAITSDSNTTDVEQDSPPVVVLQCLSPSSRQQHATTSTSSSQGVFASSTASAQPSRNLRYEQTAAAAAVAASSSFTPHSSAASRTGRVAKLIPTSCQSSLPAPHYVRKLSDFREIQQPQPSPSQHQQPVAQGSPSPSTRRRHLMIPVAPTSTTRHYQQEPSPSASVRPCVHPAQITNVSDDSGRPPVPVLRFSALPPTSVISNQHLSNMAKNRKARSYTNVGSTDEEAFEAADYIDLRELRRSPGTPGRVARFGHLYNRNALYSHPQQPSLYPQPAHAVGSYPDRNQWRLPEIRTLYVSYV